MLVLYCHSYLSVRLSKLVLVLLLIRYHLYPNRYRIEQELGTEIKQIPPHIDQAIYCRWFMAGILLYSQWWWQWWVLTNDNLQHLFLCKVIVLNIMLYMLVFRLLVFWHDWISRMIFLQQLLISVFSCVWCMLSEKQIVQEHLYLDVIEVSIEQFSYPHLTLMAVGSILVQLTCGENCFNLELFYLCRVYIIINLINLIRREG